jgi:hypothetical protein
MSKSEQILPESSKLKQANPRPGQLKPNKQSGTVITILLHKNPTVGAVLLPPISSKQ